MYDTRGSWWWFILSCNVSYRHCVPQRARVAVGFSFSISTCGNVTDDLGSPYSSPGVFKRLGDVLWERLPLRTLRPDWFQQSKYTVLVYVSSIMETRISIAICKDYMILVKNYEFHLFAYSFNVPTKSFEWHYQSHSCKKTVKFLDTIFVELFFQCIFFIYMKKGSKFSLI